MKILLDTNIILDVLLKREPFYINGAKILALSEKGKIRLFVTATSITDIFYIMRKNLEKLKAKQLIFNLLEIVEIVNVTKQDIYRSFELDFTVFEDALQSQCAHKLKADFIITRDTADFKNSIVKAISPEYLIQKIHFD